MTSATVQELLSEGSCINCYGPGGWPIIEIGLLSAWAVSLNAGAVTDPAALITSAKCFHAYSAQAWLLKLGLLKNIATGLDNTADTSPQALIEASACVNSFGPGTWPIIELALLAEITTTNDPAADTTDSVLITANPCVNNYSAQSWLMKLALLSEISLSVNPSASVEPADLLAASSCYNCYGPGLWPLMEIALLEIIEGSSTPQCVLTDVQVFLDNFTRVDSASLGANYVANMGTGLAIVSNLCRNPAGAQFEGNTWIANSFDNDQYAEITLGAGYGTTLYAIPAVRVSGASVATLNGYLWDMEGTVNPGASRILKFVNGAATDIVFVPLVAAAGDVMRLQVIGSTITAFKNGVQVATFDDTSLASGSVAIAMYGNASVSKLVGGNIRCLPPSTAPAILLESGGYILLESGGKILLE
jgi:hypothetical protein